MVDRLQDLISDLKSDKITLRQKAVDNLHEILSNKLERVQSVLDENEDITWNDIFNAVAIAIETNAHHLASKNIEPSQTDKRIASFENLILKVCESPAEGKIYDLNIPMLSFDILISYRIVWDFI